MPNFSEHPDPSDRNTSIERGLIRAMKEYQVPGVSIAVIHEYSVIWSAAYGVLQAGQTAPVHTDTLFQASSISKAVTAVAILNLVQAGFLELDTDVNSYLTSWKIPANETWQPVVTIRQLLSHTAGITVPWFYGYHRDQDIPSLLQILAGEKPSNTPGMRVNILPGTHFRYSGGGYCVLQQLLCDVKQQPFPDLMRELVLDSVEMDQSTFEQPLPSKYWGNASSGHRADGKSLPGGWHTMPEMAAAGLWTTATDLAKFSIDLQLALTGQAGHILSPEMARVLLSPLVQPEPNRAMGLGVWLEGSGKNARFGHPGDNEGFSCRWTAFQEGGSGAVIMTNSDTGWELIADVLSEVEQVYGWPEPEAENISLATPLVDLDLAKFVGTYRFRSGIQLTIAHLNGGLYLQMLPHSPILLTAVSTTIYTLQALDGEVIFLMNDKGVVRGLLLRQDGSELEAEKVS